MKRILTILTVALAACSEDSLTPEKPGDLGGSGLKESLIVCNEGLWQSDNGQLSYLDAATGTLTNQWFRRVNGAKLGDTPNDIIQVNDTLIAIAVNWSNIIQYIRPDGTACGATEDVPNNRRLCTDGRHLYVTSYAHRCGSQTFGRGFVAKIDVATKQVVATCGVGWEPEGICLYKGRLYVADTGGYAFSEAERHDYETTVHVIDAATMTVLRTIDTGCINLSSDMTLAGRHLLVGSGGDRHGVGPRTVILDCETDEVAAVLDFPAEKSATDGTLFYTVGTDFSYATGGGRTHVHTIDPRTMAVSDMIYSAEVTARILSLAAPYALCVSPFTGSVYFTDARSHATSGYLYGYSKNGAQLFEPQQLYINPGRILVLSTPGTAQDGGETDGGEQVIVDEYMPAPGQFVNLLPEAAADDTPASMAAKCTETLNQGGMVTLGGFGGYITFHFGRPVINRPAARDFTIRGNASAGSAEPGIVMVSQDTNGNGLPDDEWYELSGSADTDFPDAVDYGYEITYLRAPMRDIPWTDNRGGTGLLHRVSAHTQEYYPLWVKDDALTFRGTRLPGNATDTSGNGSYWVLSPLRYGYADNLPNSDADGCSFDLDWAVDADRRPVRLDHADFIRVYTALNQQCGWIGETSTEISF